MPADGIGCPRGYDCLVERFSEWLVQTVHGCASELRQEMEDAEVMEILSLNVGEPREVRWKGRTITTGIFKEPVPGRVLLRTLNLEGDRQADLTVHGGPTKAIYAYPGEHYVFWRAEFPGMNLPWGMFGENLTTMGLAEHSVNIGDRFRMGGAELMVTEPRLPCYKLGIKFGRDDVLKRFLASGRSGFYFAVLKEGHIGAGDAIELLSPHPHGVTVADVIRLYTAKRSDPALLERVLRVDALPNRWKLHLRGLAASNEQ
jgi:MOSC domain-containing protein YiiM